jgi:hypothetical protein
MPRDLRLRQMLLPSERLAPPVAEPGTRADAEWGYPADLPMSTGFAQRARRVTCVG